MTADEREELIRDIESDHWPAEAIADLIIKIDKLRDALSGLLQEVEYAISSETIPKSWIDDTPDMAIINARRVMAD